MIADHLRPLLVELLRVRSQTRDHVGIRVRAVWMLLLKRERGPEGTALHLSTQHTVFIKENTFSMYDFNSRNNAIIRVKQTHDVLQVFYQDRELAVRVRDVELDLRTVSCNKSAHQCQQITA